MAQADRIVTIRVEVDDQGAIRVLDAVNKKVEGTESSGKKGGRGLLAFAGAMGLASAAGNVLANIITSGVTFAVRKATEIFFSAIDAANTFTNTFIGLTTVAGKFGIAADEVKGSALALAQDGLMAVDEAAAGLKNLLASGFGLREAIQLMNGFKDSASFNRQASLGFGQAVVSATEGIKNQNSILVDNAGLTKNLTVIMKEAGLKVSDLAKVSSDAGIRSRFLGGMMKELSLFTGDAARLTETYSGSISRLDTTWSLMLAKLGSAVVENENVARAINEVSDRLVTFTENLDVEKLKQFVDDGLRLVLDAVELLTPAFEKAIDLVKGYVTQQANVTRAQELFKKASEGDADALFMLNEALQETGSVALKHFTRIMIESERAVWGADRATRAYNFGVSSLTSAEIELIGELVRAKEETARLAAEVEKATDGTKEATEANRLLVVAERDAAAAASKLATETTAAAKKAAEAYEKLKKAAKGTFDEIRSLAQESNLALKTAFFDRQAEHAAEMAENAKAMDDLIIANRRTAAIEQERLSLSSTGFQIAQIERWAREQKAAVDRSIPRWAEAFASYDKIAEQEIAKIVEAHRRAMLEIEVQARTGMQKVADQIIGADLGGIVIGAITGGGDIGRAVGAGLGDAIGSGLAESLTSGENVGRLTKTFASFLGPLGAIGGQLLGGLFDKLFSIGGPSEAEIQGRALVADFEDSIISLLSTTQQAEAGGHRWQQVVIGVRDAYVAAGHDAQAGVDAVNRLWGAIKHGGPEAVQSAIDEINKVREAADQLAEAAVIDFDEMERVANKYGIALSALGPAFKQSKIDKLARDFLADFEMLVRGGANVKAVLRGMGDEVSAFVQQSILFGTEVPANMRPMLEQMVEMGVLVDDSGAKLDSLDDLSFAETLTEGFDRVVDKLTELIDKIVGPNGVVSAIDAIPSSVNVGVNFESSEIDLPEGAAFGARGGRVAENAIHAAHGRLIRFSPRGTDTVPAMLSEGEFVMSRRGVAAAGLDTLRNFNSGGGGGGNTFVIQNNVIANDRAMDDLVDRIDEKFVQRTTLRRRFNTT